MSSTQVIAVVLVNLLKLEGLPVCASLRLVYYQVIKKFSLHSKMIFYDFFVSLTRLVHISLSLIKQIEELSRCSEVDKASM